MSRYSVKYWDSEALIDSLNNKTSAISLAKATFKKDETRDIYVMAGGEVIWSSTTIAEGNENVSDISEGTHLCNRCGQQKPSSAFGLSMGKVRNRCKQCVNEAHKEWREDRKNAESPKTPEILQIEINALIAMLDKKVEDLERLNAAISRAESQKTA